MAIREEDRFRYDLVALAIQFDYESFQRYAEQIIPNGLMEHIVPRLPELYMDVREEIGRDLEKSDDPRGDSISMGLDSRYSGNIRIPRQGK